MKNGKENSRTEIIEQLDYEVFDALEEKENFTLLAIGRPEDKGCYCQVNELLKEVIESLSRNFNIVLIDGEAGIEQIHRRVMRSVDDLLVISDPSAKGINVVNTIKEVATKGQAMDCGRIPLILNKIQKEEEVKKLTKNSELDLIGWIPEDEKVRKLDLEDNFITQIPNSSPSVRAMQEILEKLIPSAFNLE